jgi:hypothetical protein
MMFIRDTIRASNLGRRGSKTPLRINIARASPVLALAFGISALAGSPASANDISFFKTVFDTDWTTGGVGGLRPTGSGTINVTGVTGPVTQSYTYWAGPTNSTDPAFNAAATINGAPVTGTNIGFSQDNFWGFNNSQAYRANTTSVVNGNGAYTISGLDSNTNGAGSLVFFNDGNSANNRDVVVFDGNDSNFASPFDPAGWNLNLDGIKYTSGSAFITLMVSDGQNFGPNDDGTIEINGVPLVSGGIFQGDSLCCGTGPTGNGNLWDIKTFDITSFLTPGVNNLNVTLGPGTNDAIAAIVAAIDLPAGAAPPPGIPETSTWVMMLVGFASVSFFGYRRARILSTA